MKKEYTQPQKIDLSILYEAFIVTSRGGTDAANGLYWDYEDGDMIDGWDDFSY